MPLPAEGFAARLVLGPALRTQPDRRLVTLVHGGYETAFEEIVRRYGKSLTRYAAAIVGGHAEDVTQDAFSKALLALRRDGAEIELRPWLFRIVRNTALNDLRDRPPSAAELAEVIATGSGPAEELERREELADLMQRLRSLPEAQRAAIVMREMEGLSHDEIAAALGLSGGAARQAIYRARQALRDGLGMLLPMPLLKSLLAGTAAAPMEAAAGAAGVGGGTASAAVTLKAATATVLVAGAVGAGVAVHDNQRGQPQAGARPERALAEDSAATQASAVAAPRLSGDSSTRGDNRGPGSHSEGHGEDQVGSGEERGARHGGNSGPNTDTGGRGPGDGHSGHGAGEGGDEGGRRGPSGDDAGGDRHPGGSGRSPGGSSGSGDGQPSGGSGNSGPGSGGGFTGGDDGPPPSEGSQSSDSSGPGGGDSSDSGSSSRKGGDEPNFESSGDSHSGEGLSTQTEPQT